MTRSDFATSLFRGAVATFAVFFCVIVSGFMAGALRSDIGFGLWLLALRALDPFSSVAPEFPTGFHRGLLATYWIGAAVLIGLVSRRAHWAITGLVALTLFGISGFAIIELMQFFGYRYVFDGL